MRYVKRFESFSYNGYNRRINENFFGNLKKKYLLPLLLSLGLSGAVAGQHTDVGQPYGYDSQGLQQIKETDPTAYERAILIIDMKLKNLEKPGTYSDEIIKAVYDDDENVIFLFDNLTDGLFKSDDDGKGTHFTYDTAPKEQDKGTHFTYDEETAPKDAVTSEREYLESVKAMLEAHLGKNNTKTPTKRNPYVGR